MSMLRIRTGARFELTSPFETPAVFIIRPESNGSQATLEERWRATPARSHHDYVDLYGNTCRRITLPAEPISLVYEALVETGAAADPVDLEAPETPVAGLPDDALLYTLPSRYCQSDVLAPKAMELFGGLTPGWGRVQAVCDFVHNHVRFAYGSSTPLTGAVDVFENATGVCRDFAHLAIGFCRALNVPARYAFGYLPDIDVAPPYPPMDFAAWFEAYLGGRWWIFDPRNNERRRGRITIARGRDALDVAMMTTYGTTTLVQMTVIAEAAKDDASVN